LAAKPSGVSHAEAATLPLAALTAWQALVDYASLAPGESVLVHGGAGGVGVYGIQIAGLRGARVIATGRPEQEDFIRGLGAHEFIDFTAVAFDDVLTDLDVVLDPVGGDTLTRSFRVLRAGGRLVTLSSPPPPDLANQFGVEATFFIVQPDRAELIDLARFVDGGSLRPVISQVFELPDGRAAFESANKPRQPGKTVLTVLR
jgi:NADPH:quinone reductase-like Zn-dependent oxidoreductase